VLKKTGQTAKSVTVEIPVNRNYSGTSVAAGGVAFDPLTGGTTVVSATAPGLTVGGLRHRRQLRFLSPG